MARWLHVALLWLSACNGRERDCADGQDNDGDGWKDCQDQDCASSCGEQCTNLRDDDGDGQVDCVDPDCAAQCPQSPVGDEDCRNGRDEDGDWLVDCQDPECDLVCDTDADGHIELALGGDDCDDDNARVHPGADEIPYDGIDADCDPLTPDDDLDGDGFLRAQDCDDERAASWPGAPETCGDGVVNDCDRPDAHPSRQDCFGERPLGTADAKLLGTSVDDWTAFTVASAGDVDNDGTDDLLLGAYGAGADASGVVYLVTGPLQGVFDLSQADTKWVAESEDDWAGYALDGGVDLTGDGQPDAVIGARYDDATGNNAGAVYVVSTQQRGTRELFEAHAKLYAEAEYDSCGYAVAALGDIDDDGSQDLLIGSPESSANGNASGMVHLVHGPIEGQVQLVAASYRLVGERPGDRLGCAVARVGDLDGDGRSDVVVAACSSDRNAPDAGAVYQFSTHLDQDRLASEADGALIGYGPSDQLGSALSGGDLDNDGLSDIIVGAPFHDPDLEDAGAVYISKGPATVSMNQPVGRLLGVAAGDRAGTSVAWLGDLDGDGFGDLAVGAPGSDEAGTDAGIAYVVFGPVFGSHSLADADIRSPGEAPFDFAGQAVASAGDADGDGALDLLVGAPFHDGLAPSSGAAYLFTFHE